MRTDRALVLLSIVALLGASAFPLPAAAVEKTLPGGTPISVEITTPPSNADLPPGPVTVTGTAAIGKGQPQKNTGLVYVLDTSSSTRVPGCSSGNEPGDILQCEKEAAILLNDRAVDSQTVDKVGVVVFASKAEIADVGPSDDDDLSTISPEAADAEGVRHIDTVISSAFNKIADSDPPAGQPSGVDEYTQKFFGGGTVYSAAITAATQAAKATGKPNKIVAFMSDGLDDPFDNIDEEVASARREGVVFKTFAVGTGDPELPPPTCGEPASGNPTGNTLARLSFDTGGGDCTEVDDPTKLPDVLPGVIASQLTALTLNVDGGADIPITNVTPPLPRPGPATVDYSVVTPALTSGTHRLCVTAKGRDGGGEDSVTDCHAVRINVVPTVSAGGPYTGQDNVPVPIAGTVADPDSPTTTTSWSITPVSGFPPGTTCAFGNAAELSTVVTCTGEGSYTLSLTVADGVNPPVVVRTALTLVRRSGTLSLATFINPATGFVGGDPVVVTHTVRNGGVTPMTSVRVTTTLPAGLRPVTVRPTICAASCDLGSLAPGQTVQIQLTFGTDVVLDGSLSATVTTTGPDVDQADNTAAARVVTRKPVLIIDPGIGPQGFVTRATGKDFPAGARIRLRWSTGISETPGEVTVRPDGTVDTQVLIFPKDTRGSRTLIAVPAAGPTFGDVSSNPFLVIARTLKPSSFVIR